MVCNSWTFEKTSTVEKIQCFSFAKKKVNLKIYEIVKVNLMSIYLMVVSQPLSKLMWNIMHCIFLTLSWRRPLWYRNQSIDLQSKSVDWFLYDNGLRLKKVKQLTKLNGDWWSLIDKGIFYHTTFSFKLFLFFKVYKNLFDYCYSFALL